MENSVYRKQTLETLFQEISSRQVIHYFYFPLIVMSLIQRMLQGARRYTALDFAVFKVCLVVIGLRLATMIPWFTTVNPWVYGIIWLICGCYLVWKTFKK